MQPELRFAGVTESRIGVVAHAHHDTKRREQRLVELHAACEILHAQSNVIEHERLR